jgi:hypothetical protein
VLPGGAAEEAAGALAEAAEPAPTGEAEAEAAAGFLETLGADGTARESIAEGDAVAAVAGALLSAGFLGSQRGEEGAGEAGAEAAERLAAGEAAGEVARQVI